MNNPTKNLFEGKNLSEQDKIENLKSLSHSEEVKTFRKNFTQEELDKFKDVYFEKQRELVLLDQEFKKITEDFKYKIKLAQNACANLKLNINTGGFDTTEIVYLIDDQPNNSMLIYDQRGDFIFSRPLQSNERQLKIFSAKAANE